MSVLKTFLDSNGATQNLVWLSQARFRLVYYLQIRQEEPINKYEKSPKKFLRPNTPAFLQRRQWRRKNAFNLIRGAKLFSSSLVLLQNKLERSSGVGFYELV